MTTRLEFLPWDSEFLKFGVARLALSAGESARLPAALARARAGQCRLLYLVVAPDDAEGNEAARQVGAVLVDRKVTFAMPVDAADAQLAANPSISPAYAYTVHLEEVALQSGEYSRFRRDPHFAAGTYERLYGLWLRNSLARTLAREVLVYRAAPEAVEAGLLTLGLKPDCTDIGLLAVAAAGRGQGVGQRLVRAARRLTAEWGRAELQVVTQLDNQPACGFYRKCGFVEHKVEHVYHLWLAGE
ncbi:MAG: GNAT family N-acetyltransferase [Bacteroidota bacterium]|nr:GNAT family N-acetyltransferase [Bacteroidota bacterium]